MTAMKELFTIASIREITSMPGNCIAEKTILMLIVISPAMIIVSRHRQNCARIHTISAGTTRPVASQVAVVRSQLNAT